MIFLASPESKRSRLACQEKRDLTPFLPQTQDLLVELDGKPLRLGVSWREDEAEPGTLILSRVVPGSAAQLAGLQAADRIYEVGGREFQDGRDFLRLFSELPESLKMLVERRGQLREVSLDLPPVDIGAE